MQSCPISWTPFAYTRARWRYSVARSVKKIGVFHDALEFVILHILCSSLLIVNLSFLSTFRMFGFTSMDIYTPNPTLKRSVCWNIRLGIYERNGILSEVTKISYQMEYLINLKKITFFIYAVIGLLLYTNLRLSTQPLPVTQKSRSRFITEWERNISRHSGRVY